MPIVPLEQMLNNHYGKQLQCHVFLGVLGKTIHESDFSFASKQDCKIVVMYVSFYTFDIVSENRFITYNSWSDYAPLVRDFQLNYLYDLFIRSSEWSN